MTMIDSDSLATQRTILQQKLQSQRQYIAKNVLGDNPQNHDFPRSITMRFLTGKTGLRLIADIAISQVCKRHPDALVIGQGMRQLLL